MVDAIFRLLAPNPDGGLRRDHGPVPLRGVDAMTADGVSCDPGVNKGHGVAVWSGGKLVRAYLMPRDGMIVEADPAATLAVEIPVVRDTSLQKGSQKDITNLAIAAGMLIGRHQRSFASVVEVYPEQWGGQVPAHIKFERILQRLTPEERNCIEKPALKKLNEDVLAAIGIGFLIFSPDRALTRRGK
jgi:hypothetical protein